MAIPEKKGSCQKLTIAADPHTGALTSILADGREVLRTPRTMKNTFRFCF